MEKVAFKMYLKNGCEEEYKKRHREIWPELSLLLKDAGIKEYSIFWDKETNILFAVQAVGEHTSQDMGANEIVQKWWRYMADLMETNMDYSPVSDPLQLVFHLDWTAFRIYKRQDNYKETRIWILSLKNIIS